MKYVERGLSEPDPGMMDADHEAGYFWDNQGGDPQRLSYLGVQGSFLALLVASYTGQFRGVMIDGKLGMEAVKLAYHTTRKFGLNHFRWVVTNSSSDFSIEQEIAEADNRPIFSTAKELTFFKENHHLVEYVNIPEGSSLHQELTVREIKSVHWMAMPYRGEYSALAVEYKKLLDQEWGGLIALNSLNKYTQQLIGWRHSLGNCFY